MWHPFPVRPFSLVSNFDCCFHLLAAWWYFISYILYRSETYWECQAKYNKMTFLTTFTIYFNINFTYCLTHTQLVVSPISQSILRNGRHNKFTAGTTNPCCKFFIFYFIYLLYFNFGKQKVKHTSPTCYTQMMWKILSSTLSLAVVVIWAGLTWRNTIQCVVTMSSSIYCHFTTQGCTVKCKL